MFPALPGQRQGSGKVWAEELDVPNDFGVKPAVHPSGGVKGWVKSHPWYTALCIAAVVAVIVVAVVVPLTMGGGGGGQEPTSFRSPRLLVRFGDLLVDALQLLPPLLREYATNTRLDSSAIQVLDFVDEATLNEAIAYLEQDLTLEILIRDFMVSGLPARASQIIDVDGILKGLRDGNLASIIEELRRVWGAVIGGFSNRRRVPINDPYYINGSQYYIDLINATGAWSLMSGLPNVVVALVDTGVDLEHPDLKGQLWTNPGEIPGNGIDDDGNGYIDDVHGYDFQGGCTARGATGACTSCSGRSSPSAASEVGGTWYHGTHTAGLISGAQNNGMGITGLAPNARLMVLKVSDCTGAIPASAVFQAFDYATRMGAHVVSASIGGTYDYGFAPTQRAPSYHVQWDAAYRAAMSPMAAKGMLVVTSAGNERIDMDALRSLGYSYAPCLIDLPNVMCVGSTTHADKPASEFTNFGRATVDIGAPGKQIYSTYYTNTSGVIRHTYAPATGTSYSTPIVAGAAATVVALLGAIDGNFYRGPQLRELLLGSTTSTAASLPFGAGRLNMGAAMHGASVSLGTSLPRLAGDVSLPASTLSFPGFSEDWFAAVGPSSRDNASVVVDGGTARSLEAPSLPPIFTGWKYSGGALVALSARLRLNVSGVWGIKVSTLSASGSTHLTVSGAALQMNAGTQAGALLLESTGYLDFELRISHPSASARYDLLLRGPTESKYAPYYDFLSSGPDPAAVPVARAAGLSAPWQAFYNAADTSTQPLSPSSPASATPGVVYAHAGFALQDPATDLTAANLLPGAPASAVVGYLKACTRPDLAWAAPVSFHASCMGCQLLIDGVLLIDASEPITTGVRVSKSSPCVTFAAGARPHEVTLRFALATPTGVALSYQVCTAGSARVAAAALLPLRGLLYNGTGALAWP
ncbi:hypothetical protein FOA52_008797 [Chlamydomonas sp. UWO 241]|nr:hypothetical protein FOA52_008797 [Chlamydomonas sp. UWO 241]